MTTNNSDRDNNGTDTTAELLAQIGRLKIMLEHARRVYADLVAACRAALGAHADGEEDPWSYLRDELPPPPPEHPQSRDHDRHAGGGW